MNEWSGGPTVEGSKIETGEFLYGGELFLKLFDMHLI